MMTSDGRVLLTDFGIAKGLQSAEADLTSDNIMMGTAKYLSPGTGPRQEARRPCRPVLARPRAVRVPRRTGSVPRRDRRRHRTRPTATRPHRPHPPPRDAADQAGRRHPSSSWRAIRRSDRRRAPTWWPRCATLRRRVHRPIDPTPYEQSPVSPFGGRRLRRAPSDIAGRAGDRARATRPSDTTDAPPTTSSAARSPARSPTCRRSPTPPATPAHRDPTPPAVALARQARQGTHPGMASGVHAWSHCCSSRRSWSACLLWTSMSFGGGDPVTSTTALPATPSSDQAPSDAVRRRRAGHHRHRHRVRPERRRHRERRRRRVVARRRQRSPPRGRRRATRRGTWEASRASAWSSRSTTCAQQAITVDVQTGPYQVDFFASDAEAIPASLDAWGPPLGVHGVRQRPRDRGVTGAGSARPAHPDPAQGARPRRDLQRRESVPGTPRRDRAIVG